MDFFLVICDTWNINKGFYGWQVWISRIHYGKKYEFTTKELFRSELISSCGLNEKCALPFEHLVPSWFHYFRRFCRTLGMWCLLGGSGCGGRPWRSYLFWFWSRICFLVHSVRNNSHKLLPLCTKPVQQPCLPHPMYTSESCELR